MLKNNVLRIASRLMPITLVAFGFALGFIFAEFDTSDDVAESALDGNNNLIIEALSGVTTANPINIYQEPDISSPVVDRLLWGDRVLWRGVEQTDANNNRWVSVSIAEGVSGWMMANPTEFSEGRIVLSSAIYTTPGIGIGSNVLVSADGAGANLRLDPSVSGERVRSVEAGEQLQVIGGPYQNEYFIWWKFSDSNGEEGWMVDIEGWLSVQ